MYGDSITLLNFSDLLKDEIYHNINQNPDYLKAAAQLRHIALHGKDDEITGKLNLIREGLGVIVGGA